MTDKLPSSKQLETNISRALINFYKSKIEFVPNKISCKLFSEHLIVVVEEGLSLVEQSLLQTGKVELGVELGIELNSILKLELTRIVEEILQVDVVEIMSGTTHKTNRLGILVVLSQPPLIREFKPTSRIKK